MAQAANSNFGFGHNGGPALDDVSIIGSPTDETILDLAAQLFSVIDTLIENGKAQEHVIAAMRGAQSSWLDRLRDAEEFRGRRALVKEREQIAIVRDGLTHAAEIETPSTEWPDLAVHRAFYERVSR